MYQGRDCPLSLINISVRADSSQEAPYSIIGSSSPTLLNLLPQIAITRLLMSLLKLLYSI